MKSAKKLLLLALSLMLLIGVFAVAAFAEDAPATVVYPDGTTQTVAVGETIAPKDITDKDGVKLFYGEGNTLFKFKGEGWIFTVEGADAALEDLTVTADMAGKQIIASGVDKVYYTSSERVGENTTFVYHLVDNVDRFMSAANTGDRGDGTNTGASSRDVLGLKDSSTSIVLYEDVKTDNFCTDLMPAGNRQNTSIPLYLDLNGHTVINNYAGSYVELRGVSLRLYSSVPGATWYQPNTPHGFYVSDDGTLCIGSTSVSDTNFTDNISVYVTNLFAGHWGNGAYIVGGHFYQLPGGSKDGFVSVCRRVRAVQNASFYPLAGASVFSDVADSLDYYEVGRTDNPSAVQNCKFYGSDASSVLTSKNSAKIIFDNCTFYGMQATCNGSGTVDATTYTNTMEEAVSAVSYKTLTYADGKVSYFHADTLEEAKAYAETATKNPKPYGKWVDGEYFAALNPSVEIIYDENLNATETLVDGELTKVYFTTETSAGITYHTTDTAHSYIHSGNVKATTTMKLYSDVNAYSFSLGTDSSGYTMKLDLNGYNVSIGYRIGTTYGQMYIYSSVPGANFVSTATNGMIFANDSSRVYLGDDGSGSYINNISFHTPIVTTYNYGSGTDIIGGHYYQTKAGIAFVDISRRLNQIKNATFYLAPGSTAVLAVDKTFSIADVEGRSVSNGTNAINNCTFYSADGNVAVLYSSVDSAKPVFTNCKFYGVDAKVSGTGTLTAGDTNTIDVNGVTYKTAKWYDNSVSYFVANTLDEAKFFVENYPASAIAPFAASDDGGRTMYYVANPTAVITYDDQFNAVQTAAGERQKVYYSVARSGYDTYYSVKDNVNTIFTAGNFGGGSYDVNVTLYADVDASTFAFGTNSGSIGLNFDMNGYTVSVGGVVYITYVSARIYSSVPGAKFISTSSDGTLFYNKSTLILGTNYGGSYAGNVSFYAKAIVGNNDAGNLHVRGGNYYQTGASAIGGLFTLNSKVYEFKNSNVYVQDGQSAFAHNADLISGTVANGNVAITNCNFYSVGAANLINAAKTCALVFNGCKFINVAPVKTLGAATMFYNGDCYFNLPGGENLYTDETPLYTVRIDPVAVSGLVAADGTPIDASVIYSCADASGALKISAENMPTTYWAIGATFVASPGEFDLIDGSKYYYNPVYNVSEVAEIVDGKIAAAGEITLTISFLDSDDIAFIYTWNGIVAPVLYNVDCGGSAKGVGDKFYEIFAVPQGEYSITLYADMYLTKAMGFGPLVMVERSDGYNADYYDSLKNGNITWDLNGCTVTIDKDLVGINLSAANHKTGHPESQNAYKPAVFAFESSYGRVFTITSSKAGAKIINNSSAALFGVGEGDSCTVKIDDADNNITVRTLGDLFGNIENYATTALIINGGTYIYDGAYAMGVISRGTQMSGATFICTNPVAAFFAVDLYRSNDFVANNCTFYAASPVSVLVKSNGSTSTLSFAFNNCTFVNVKPVPTLGAATVQYSSALVSTEDDLAIAYANADLAGLVKAYTVKNVNGADCKLIGYFAENAATLVDWGFGIREYWANGATASHANVEVDGLFAYGFNSFVVGEGEAKATMIAMKPGTISMFVTLQSKIGVTLEFSADLIGATIKLGAAEVTLTEELLALSQAIAPNAAYGETVIAIVIGDNTHEISVSLEDYAEILLGSEAYADVHNLTYAMIEYVRAMIPAGKTFCEGAIAPAGYEKKVLVAEESANGEGMLENIAFCLDGTIAIAINGKTEAIGKNVNLVLATGRSETETVNEDGTVLFEGLYVNEFFGEMTITVEGEIYYYSLANYLKGIGGESAAVQALYNYAFYANAYVATLGGAN